MHESTKRKISDKIAIYFGIYSSEEIYLRVMLYSRENKFWSDSIEEIEQYIAEKTILKDEV